MYTPRRYAHAVSMSSVSGSAAAKLGAYGLILVAVLGGGAAVGAAFGPEPVADGHSTHGESAVTAELPEGLVISQDGYRFQLTTTIVEAGTPAPLSFEIIGPDGAPVTAFDTAHDKQLHLLVVSRDLRTFAHVHPERDAAGTWTVTLPALAAGSYRVYADFVPTDHAGMTLAADLAVPGDFDPRPAPAPASHVSVDGYDVRFDGRLVAGTAAELVVTVTRDGRPVTDLQPYLGALGHLVVIRDGDLAYLHVHPLDALDGAGGPAVRFAVDVPTAGTYGLFFDFSHDGAVHDASVVATAEAG